MKRPVFSFRPNMAQADHVEAWDVLKNVPEGQKNQFLVRAILHEKEAGYLEALLRQTVREELKGAVVPPERLVPAEKSVPEPLLDFISMLQDE